MNSIAEYLDFVKKKAKIKNDYNLALNLNITPGAMFEFRHNKSIPSDETCIKLAKLAGDNAERIVLLAHKLRARTKEEKTIWNSILKKAIGFSIIALLLWNTLPNFTPTDSLLYIMRQ